jgi:predicted nucleic acid-binding protein
VSRVRKIDRRPVNGINHYVVDASFLANRYIPERYVPAGKHLDRVRACNAWWQEIEAQLESQRARVYIPDVCIAETFKVLAKKYYEDGWFPNSGALGNARNKLRRVVTVPTGKLRQANRHIKYHDISTTRDIIIAVDRFYELFHSHAKVVSIPDLIIVATAKYLVDFYDVPKAQLHIVTLDRPLYEGTFYINELPNAYNPTLAKDAPTRVFR